MTTPTLTSKLDAMVADLALDLKAPVATIESGPQITQNHYGRYLTLLATLAKGDRRMTFVVALALVAAGANREGVASAVKLST